MMNSQTAKPTGEPMISASSGSVPLPSAWTRISGLLFAHRLTIYICVLLVGSLAAYGYGIRTRTIFACQANGYSADRYLAYCNGANYADYEHGAFQFNLEPTVPEAVRNADVVFLGNSRVPVAYSTAPTERWFSANSARYYVLGFSYYENSLFESGLLERIQPRASVYVINVNDFFVPTETVPVKVILHDPKAADDYKSKRFWQGIHQRVCGTLPIICGKQYVIFRSRETGAYRTEGAVDPKVLPVTYNSVADPSAVETNVAAATDFLSRFAKNKCVILTIVPYNGTDIGTAKAIAGRLGLPLVTPENVQGLQTFDGWHLDQPSAQRWSEAFFQAAGPRIRSCLDSHGATDSKRP
jgi:hypothetical protein